MFCESRFGQRSRKRCADLGKFWNKKNTTKTTTLKYTKITSYYITNTFLINNKFTADIQSSVRAKEGSAHALQNLPKISRCTAAHVSEIEREAGRSRSWLDFFGFICLLQVIYVSYSLYDSVIGKSAESFNANTNLN